MYCHKQHGFTLLELLIALSITGVLVCLLVLVWLQVVRNATALERETVQVRARESQRIVLRNILEGAQWTSNSLMPQGAMPWLEQGGFCQIWSRRTLGLSPGPVMWVVGPSCEAQWKDPDGMQGQVTWSEVKSIQVEVLRDSVGLDGERMEWIHPSQWEVGQPFNPVGVQLKVVWIGGREELIRRSH